MSYHQSNPYLEPAKEEPDAPPPPPKGQLVREALIGFSRFWEGCFLFMAALAGFPARALSKNLTDEEERNIEPLKDYLKAWRKARSEAKAAEEERRYNQRIAERSKEPPDAIE